MTRTAESAVGRAVVCLAHNLQNTTVPEFKESELFCILASNRRRSITMHRSRHLRTKQVSKVGNLYGEMPFIQEERTPAIAVVDSEPTMQSPLGFQPTQSTPVAPKIYKATLPTSKQERLRQSDIIFPTMNSPAALPSAEIPLAPILSQRLQRSPIPLAPTLSKASDLSSGVVNLGALDPNDYKLSRAQAA